MLGIRHKLLLGFGGVFLIAAVAGILSIWQFTLLGQSVDVILRENYRSVVAAQDMKEALERIDSGALFCLSGYQDKGEALIEQNLPRFREALGREQKNITLPGEGERTEHLAKVFGEYTATLDRVKGAEQPIEARRKAYFDELFPKFGHIKDDAQAILEMNQQNMSDANVAARNKAASATRYMYILLTSSAIVALAFIAFSNVWILRPIRALTESARDISQGNLELSITSTSRDEIGQLTDSFNTMAHSLRETRRSERMELNRTRRATEEVFAHLPAAVAVLDLGGRVELATASTRNYFNLVPGMGIADVNVAWMKDLFGRAITENRPVSANGTSKMVQHFVGGKEYFFRPLALPIHDSAGIQTGVLVLFEDVTQLREQEEIKRGVISTVSHQLKTPLTSIRMGIHLLLDEKVGTLTERQSELLIAARDDSERLEKIIEDLLEISRIESGRANVQPQELPPDYIVMDALDAAIALARDKSLHIVNEVPGSLDNVKADPSLVSHVITNLLGNAIKFSPIGGTVTISAEQKKDGVRFVVSDNGPGIPEENVPRVFDAFFRTPSPDGKIGAGLGLSIAKEIVHIHGGTIGVESKAGEGARFWFTLPLAGHRESGKEIGGPLLLS